MITKTLSRWGFEKFHSTEAYDAYTNGDVDIAISNLSMVISTMDMNNEMQTLAMVRLPKNKEELETLLDLCNIQEPNPFRQNTYIETE